MKTIARNRKAYIESLFARAYDCVSHSLENSYVATPCSVDAIRGEVFDPVSPSLLKEKDDGTYIVRVCGRLWYCFKVRPEAKPYVPGAAKLHRRAHAAFSQANREIHPALCGCSDCPS